MPAIPPLHPDAWDEFMAALRRGPTPEQARAVERALEIARRTPVRGASAVPEEAYLPLQDSAIAKSAAQARALSRKRRTANPSRRMPHERASCRQGAAVPAA